MADLSNIAPQSSLEYQYFCLIIQDYSPQLITDKKE
jgi:hypothetical protein